MNQDQDIEFMDRSELKAEIRRLRERERGAIAVLQEWLDKQGHDRCWWFPELFKRLVELWGLKPTKEPNLPPENEFEAGCTRFRIEEYGKARVLQTVSPPEANQGRHDVPDQLDS